MWRPKKSCSAVQRVLKSLGVYLGAFLSPPKQVKLLKVVLFRSLFIWELSCLLKTARIYFSLITITLVSGNFTFTDIRHNYFKTQELKLLAFKIGLSVKACVEGWGSPVPSICFQNAERKSPLLLRILHFDPGLPIMTDATVVLMTLKPTFLVSPLMQSQPNVFSAMLLLPSAGIRCKIACQPLSQTLRLGFLGCCRYKNVEVLYRQWVLRLNFIDNRENCKKLLTSVHTEFLQISSYREDRNHAIGSFYW